MRWFEITIDALDEGSVSMVVRAHSVKVYGELIRVIRDGQATEISVSSGGHVGVAELRGKALDWAKKKAVAIS